MGGRPDFGQLGGRQLCKLRLAVRRPYGDGNGSHAFLENDPSLGSLQRNDAGRGEHVRGADGGMAGKLQLAARGEDAHLGGMARVVGREHERRFGVVELPRDVLHESRLDVSSIGKDRELVTAKAVVGENVCREISGAHVGKM